MKADAKSTESRAQSRLAAYRSKRDFGSTPEPELGTHPDSDGPRFVVHEHHATRLHWDLRLEHDGTLASWAVPNGIPADPKHNRKAIRVEDHPLSYLEFEGTIPSGSYGAGEIKIWDRGTFVCEKWRADEVIVAFFGQRLRGRYALFSAGRSEKDWMIHRMDPPLDPTAEEMPEFVELMLAKLSKLPRADSEWAFEVKWDGIRALAHSRPGRLRLFSRNRNEVTPAYPELRALNRALGSHSAILDGEIVAFDARGRPSFEELQPRMHVRGAAAVRRLARATPVTYVLFDLLWLDGHSMMALSYAERRERLAALELDAERWCTPAFQIGDGAAFLAATRDQGLEGVVAKRLDSRYAPGRRDAGWLKIKHSRSQEAVIGGWTKGKGSRESTIGALQLGVHDEQDVLRYAGRVGSGFDTGELARLTDLLKPIARKGSPFVGTQPPRGAYFVEPQLVCEVEFTAWTKDGLMRHPVYKGLREDKPPDAVIRELVEEPDRAPSRHPSAVRRDRAEHAQITSMQALGSLADLSRVHGGWELLLEGRSLKLTKLDKVLYPQTGFTKGDLIEYYASIAPVLLPHLAGRPLTLKRYPDGVEAEHFYEKQCPKHRPEWVQTASLWSESNKQEIDYCLCQDLPTLVWLANLAAIELHPSLARAEAIERPTAVAFDLDPGRPAGIVECCVVALELREMFAQLGLRSYAKTSGSKGLQVYVPLGDDDVTYDETKPFAHAVADVLERRRPELVVSRMAKSRRRGKVLIDWSQNDEHKTTVSAYSLRAMATPTVSAPLAWEEVERCRSAQDAKPLELGAALVPRRVRERGDLFAEVLSLRQALPVLDG